MSSTRTSRVQRQRPLVAMVLLVRTHRETTTTTRMLPVLLLAAGGSLVFNDDLDTALGAGLMAFRSLVFLAQPSRSWASGISRAAIWSLDNMYSEEQCWAHLRFRKADLPLLLQALRLPNVIRIKHASETRRGHHHIFSGMEALVTFLSRMATAATWEQQQLFLGGRARSAYTGAFYHVLHHIWDNYAGCITDINRWSAWALTFANAAINAGSPAQHCVGFLDGTIRSSCRPSRHQRLAYTGYGRRHGLKFQTVVSPNGMITDFFGPVLARHGDGHMLRVSHLLQRMATFCAAAGGHYYIYGDSAYPLHQYLLRGLKGVMTPQQQAFCTAMSTVRESVEWGYNLIVTLWPLLDVKRALKFYKTPIALLYSVGALMANVHNCFYGNMVLAFFQKTHDTSLAPPSAEEYLNA